jgi:aryl-alcohol dehydrogenase-like predicted oxidoreductase
MQSARLGSSDLEVSRVGLGCNNFGMRCDQEQTSRVVARALDLGVTLFDTADIYGGQGKSEEFLGKALGSRRSQIVLATKFGGPMGQGLMGAKAAYITRAVEASLTRLGTDYIDLYQLHFPDPTTPIEETLRGLDECVRAGKVRYIGCSNFSGWQLVESLWTSKAGNLSAFVTAQNQYSLLDRRIERELAEACKKYSVGILPYFPLASGLLTGKYQRGAEPPKGTRLAMMGARADRFLNDRNMATVEKLQAFAESRGHTLLELAFSWLVCQPYVPSVIAGATRPEQLDANVNAASWQLTPEEMAEVDKLTKS